ncbi:MAG: Lsr2 family protein [Actinomycetota bacterium]|nr:Lsr2 family protein [Actinomycetota bacterium]
MAQVTKVELIDDLSGDKADETVTFGLDGVVFDIDLSANNAGILRDIFEDYVNAGHKVSKLTSSSARRNTTASTRQSRDQTAAIREWARKAGHVVSDRGRISATVTTAFQEAHRSLAEVG